MSFGKMVGKVFKQAQAQKLAAKKPAPAGGMAGMVRQMQSRVQPSPAPKRGIGGMIQRARQAQTARPAAPSAANKPSPVSGQRPSRAQAMRQKLQAAKMARPARPTAQSNTQARIKTNAAQPAAVSGRQPPARPAGGGSFGRGGSRKRLY